MEILKGRPDCALLCVDDCSGVVLSADGFREQLNNKTGNNSSRIFVFMAYPFSASFAQVSFSVMVRLKMSFPGCESLSSAK